MSFSIGRALSFGLVQTSREVRGGISVRRNPYIDALRGLSIVLVVVLHVRLRVRLQDSFLFRHTPEVVWAFLCRNGHNGVRIFFVISGFLITLTSLARWAALDRIDVRRFYQLRFARIAPLLLALLAVLSVLHLLQLPGYTIDPPRASLERALLSALTLHLNIHLTQAEPAHEPLQAPGQAAGRGGPRARPGHATVAEKLRQLIPGQSGAPWRVVLVLLRALGEGHGLRQQLTVSLECNR